MTKKDTNSFMKIYKQKFFIPDDKVKVIHATYIKDFNKALAKSKDKNPEVFIDNILNFCLTNEFDPNLIRAVFGKSSKLGPIYKEELEEFKKIFFTKMLKK